MAPRKNTFNASRGRRKGSQSSFKKGPKERLAQFNRESPGHGLIIKNNGLFCQPCGHGINHDRKSVIQQHLESSTHLQRKDVLVNIPPIADSLDFVERKNRMWEEMTRSFMSAGVPLHVFTNDSVRGWLNKYVTDGQTLPCVTTLRKEVKCIGEEDIGKTIQICKDREITIIADEGTDIMNRKVLNVLVAPVEPNAKPRLAYTEIVERCDGISISNAILEALRILKIRTDQVICLKTDNAKSMGAAARTLKGLCPRLIYSTCWSHVMHLVAEQVRLKLGKVDAFIANLKASLVKCPARRTGLLDALERNGMTKKLPPFPVLTRWCTWLECGDYVYEHLDAIVEYVLQTEGNSAAVQRLADLVKVEDDLDNLKFELEMVHELRLGICSTLRKLESNKLDAHNVWLMLETVNELCKSVNLGVTVLDMYMNAKHPAKDFWHQVQFFDPRKIDQFSDAVPATIQKIAKLPVPSSELATYKIVCRDYKFEEGFDVRDFWKKYSREMPVLSGLAKQCLSFLTSTSDVERSFSCLRRILTSLRNKLSEENLGIHLRISFNKLDVEQCELPGNSWDDDL